MFSLKQGGIASFNNDFPTGIGIVNKVVTPGEEWRVRIRGTYWKAKAAIAGHNFVIGDTVTTVARQGLTLLITPTEDVLSESRQTSVQQIESHFPTALY